MAPQRLKRNITCLHVLSKARKPQRDAIINTANKDLILCICDCAHNFLNGNISFTEKEIRQLKRYQDYIRHLANKKREPIQNKKNIIIQKGGFLPLLLTPILSAFTQTLLDAIQDKK